MRKYALNEITLMQYIMIINGMAVSISFIDIPAIMATQAGTDGWISILIGGMVTMLASLLVIKLMRKSPDGTLFDMLNHYFGRWAGITTAVLFAVYFFLYGYVGLIYTLRLVKGRLLLETPYFLIMTMLMIPTYMIARNGLRVVGRYAEFTILTSLWIPFVYVYTYKNLHLLYLLPVLKDGWQPVLTAVPRTFFFYLGFAASAILYPFVKHKKHAPAAILTANALSMFSYLGITLICFAFMSPDEALKIHQPAIYVLKSVELSFIEQVEGLFIAFYTFMFSLSWIPPMYMIAFCLTWIAGKQDHRLPLRIIIILTAGSALFFLPTYEQLFNISSFLGKFGIAIEYMLPSLLIACVWLHERLVPVRRRP